MGGQGNWPWTPSTVDESAILEQANFDWMIK